MRRFSTYLWLNCRQRISENVTEKKKTVKHGNITNETRETESEKKKKSYNEMHAFCALSRQEHIQHRLCCAGTTPGKTQPMAQGLDVSFVTVEHSITHRGR